MALLNSKLFLHGVDCEELATEVAHAWAARNRGAGSYLSESRREDLVAYLISEVWRVSVNYDPERSQRFRSYARSILYFRCTDWLRRDEGRTVWKFAGSTHERERPKLVPLDDGDPMGLPHLNPESGGREDRLSDVPGMEDHGDRTADRDNDLIRAAAHHRAA